MTTAASTTLGRLGAWTADHRRLVVIAWGVAVLALGALAPFADRALSGAGWEAPSSESGEARRAIESRFPGQGTYAMSVVLAGERAEIGDRPMHAALAGVRGVLRDDPAVSGVLPPRQGVTVSRDRRTVIVTGLAGAAPSEMVEAAGRLKDRLARLSKPGVTVRLTGPAAMWSDFNHANKAAMMKSEALSWPLTLALLVLAFGTLLAAGLPLLLTMAGLLGAGGLLFVCGQLFDVSIWAMNFAMMFAIALGIDYTVFLLATTKEAYQRTGDARRAVVEGLASTGRVINAAAAVMIVVFMTFALAGPIPPKEMGFILAVAVLLDATLVRLLLQPVTLRLFGPRAWWMPAWLNRLLPSFGLSHDTPEAEPTDELSIADQRAASQLTPQGRGGGRPRALPPRVVWARSRRSRARARRVG